MQYCLERGKAAGNQPRDESSGSVVFSGNINHHRYGRNNDRTSDGFNQWPAVQGSQWASETLAQLWWVWRMMESVVKEQERTRELIGKGKQAPSRQEEKE